MCDNVDIISHYKEIQNKRRDDTLDLLSCIRHKHNVLKVIKQILRNYTTMVISGLRKFFYKWFEAEYAFNEMSYRSEEYAWMNFDIMMNRIISLELLYAQFPKEGKTEDEIKLFILYCNKMLGSRDNTIKNLPLLGYMNTYNNIYKEYHYWVTDNELPMRNDKEFIKWANKFIIKIQKWNEKCEYYF